jgi:hypothetical protein
MDQCERESVTPDGDSLIVDCSVHGEVGSVPAGTGVRQRTSEYDRVEALWTKHAADQR